MINIYTHGQSAEFYRRHNMPLPKDLLDTSGMIMDLSGPADQGARPVFERFLSRRDIAMLYGPPNIGKSPFAESIMYALTRGCDLDRLHVIGAPMSVLMVNGEMRKEQLQRRKAWYEKMYPRPNADAFFEVAKFSENLAEPHGQKLLEQLIRECNAKHKGQQNIGVVILDSLKTLTKSGDGQKGWNELFAYLNRARTEHDRTWIVIHHTNKQEKQSFGTFDIDIKLDVKVQLSEEIPNLEAQIARPGISTKELKGYKDYLSNLYHQEFAGERANAIRFYMTFDKGRDLPNNHKKSILLSFRPEDDKPEWKVEDIFDSDSPWSFENWSDSEEDIRDMLANTGKDCADKVIDDEESRSETTSLASTSASSKPTPSRGSIPSYSKLRELPKDDVVKYLKYAVELSQCSSRRELGVSLSCSDKSAKDRIDYLMKKYKLTNEEIGLKSTE